MHVQMHAPELCRRVQEPYLITSVSLHPNQHLTPLDEEVPPGSYEISSIKAGLVLGGHKFPLCSQFVPVLHRADGVVLRNTRET